MLDFKTLKPNDVLICTRVLCVSWKKELIITVATDTRIIAEDKKGIETLYKPEQLTGYIKKENKNVE